MNKGRRQELKQLKYIKRLRRIGQLNAETIASPIGERHNFTGFKNHSVPCSCFMCSYKKFDRAKEKRDIGVYENFIQATTYMEGQEG